MIYDCFTFFNELDLLEIRLNTLNDVVDRFVIAEATRTFTGKPKELLFEKNKARYAAFLNKVIYIKVDNLLPEEEITKDTFNLPWVNENRQRNALIQGLANTTDDDIIMISDLDEIPAPGKICEAASLVRKGAIVRFILRGYMYFANFRSYRDPWWSIGTQMTLCKTLRLDARISNVPCGRFVPMTTNVGPTISKLRATESTFNLADAGWHFTYLGGSSAIRHKLESFSHTEATVVIPKVEERLAAGENIFGGKRDSFAVPIDDTLPRYLLDNRERFAHLFFNVTPDYMKRTALPRRIATLRGICYRFCVRLVPKFLVGPLSTVWRWVNFR